jgi:DNA topoisomerase I
MSKLIIVESPTKAKTIKGFLGKDYIVDSSYGHVRDLPKSKLGVDTENNFEPTYEVPLKAKKQVAKLKKLAKDAEMVYFASDEDREGEAISWHLEKLLNVDKKKQKRIVFHEITKTAIMAALENPRDLDINLFHAQEARRILDRLVGYKLSPLLWKKVTRGLSAGRVQSVAVRLIVEREEERRKFKAEEYWTVAGEASKDKSPKFDISLHKEKDKVLKKFDIDEKKAKQAEKDIKANKLQVTDVKATEHKKAPLAPFTTSTLQQDAHRRFGYSAKQIMMLAQQLYEGIKLGSKGSHGLITYMRTDSFNLSDSFKSATEEYINDKLGAEYIEKGGRVFKKKTKHSQEAHEAIRPTEVTNDPESVKDYLDPKQLKIYTLIWQRAVASQMTEAVTETTSVAIDSMSTDWTLKAVGTVTKFAGWKEIYKNNSEENELPAIAKDDILNLDSLESIQHFTTPPARYSEAGLVKAMEALEIGRPSTYAPTISTIITRQYVTKEEKRLAPTEIGEIVNKLLMEHFPDIVSYDFTAQMEDDLDKIAEGKKEWQPIISEFYKPFEKNLMIKEKEIDKKAITETASDEKCDKCKHDMVIKLGRFGKFLACTNYPECKNTKPIGDDGKPEKLEKIDEPCPTCGKDMILKTGRFGKFIACSDYPKCKTTKSKDQGTGVKCGLCKDGEMVTKRSKRGKIFYGCDQYPKCEHLLWGKPTGKNCPDCKKLLYTANKSTIKCEDCDYVEKIDPAKQTEE